MADTLKEKTTKGLFWGALNSGTTQVLNLLIGIMLGRLLSPPIVRFLSSYILCISHCGVDDDT